MDRKMVKYFGSPLVEEKGFVRHWAGSQEE